MHMNYYVKKNGNFTDYFDGIIESLEFCNLMAGKTALSYVTAFICKLSFHSHTFVVPN